MKKVAFYLKGLDDSNETVNQGCPHQRNPSRSSIAKDALVPSDSRSARSASHWLSCDGQPTENTPNEEEENSAEPQRIGEESDHRPSHHRNRADTHLGDGPASRRLPCGMGSGQALTEAKEAAKKKFLNAKSANTSVNGAD